MTRPEETWRAIAWMALQTGFTRHELMEMELDELSSWISQLAELVKQGHSPLAR